MKISDRLEAALKRRQSLLDSAQTNAYRLFCGAREGIEGVTLDRYADYAVLHAFEAEEGVPEQVADWARERLKVKGVYRKEFVADRSAQLAESGMYSATPFRGEAAPEQIEILEEGTRFEIRLYSGYATGLFLDQRANRTFLAEECAGLRVLNLFSYTCGFSVKCAAAGAETVSVDVSKKYLDWGRRNFSLNGVEPAEHKFFVDDAREFLARSFKRGERFDLVILDPPSFGRGKKGKAFSLQKDLGSLLKAAAAVLEEGGSLFVSSNYSKWTSHVLEKELKSVLPHGKKRGLPKEPLDFSMATHALSNVLVRN